ncbi:MAG: hypothetical protein QOI10_2573 [Solirubrobacterales bacterium]|jgi:glycosyltransferase involved in cell wall biosynthesis|nr:hypothetical protein [Solirubrobacterales bacterium]
MTILFMTTVLPGGRRTGGEVASSSFIEAMRSNGHRVVVIGYQRPGAPAPLDPDVISAGTRPIESRDGGVRVGAWLASAIARGLPYSIAKYRSRRYRRVLQATALATPPDLLVIDHAQMGWALPVEGPGRPVALLAHNLEHELYGEAAGRGGGPVGWMNRREARLMEGFERRIARAVDRVWTLTRTDAAALNGLGAPSVRAFALPPSVEVDDRHTVPEHDVGILGTWTWSANATGLRWFVDEVRPLLPPSVSVGVAGAGSEPFAAGPNLVAAGRVDDAASFLRSSRVVAVPSLAGGGLQIKTLDAIASGMPVVATPTALRGIDDPPPTVRVAESPKAFAAAIERVLQSPAGEDERRSAAGWVQRRRDQFRSELAEELTEAVGA